jgi:hypothetical protein
MAANITFRVVGRALLFVSVIVHEHAKMVDVGDLACVATQREVTTSEDLLRALSLTLT